VSNSETYRARLRFRLQKKLNIKDKEYRFHVGVREVVLSPQLPDLDISDSEWLVMNTRGFECEGDAKAFARKLKSACEVSSVSARLGIDTGTDLPTSGFGKLVKDRFREQSGLLIRDNIHGVDVFLDDPNVRIANFGATGTVRAPPNPFLEDLSGLSETVGRASQSTRDIVLLLNYALLRPEPVAQIVFSFSAVEMLGQNADWSSDQRRLLNELAASALKMEIGSVSEREEVVTAIQKGMHKLSLRQGVLRLLASLNLESLKPTWDKLYSERSTLIHGLAPKPGVDYSGLAHRSVSLCGQILLTAISREVPGANNHVDSLYEL
jgi:hypothetical protein